MRRVYFDNVNFSSNSGPNTFATRLAERLTFNGHTIADPDDYDIALVFIEPTRELNKRKPSVHRLDGIWFSPEEFERRNRPIREFFRRANHVIFQSDFDRKMVINWWDEPKTFSVIHNGIDTTPAAPMVGFERLRKTYKNIFICSSSWHPQKRLKSNIELFKHLRAVHGASCLVIVGPNPDVTVADPDIFYAGRQTPEVCLQMYRSSDWFLHLAWLDHCPNVVIEALSQGLPVICSSEGGTAELVGPENGIVLKDDSEYNFELTYYDKPPKINVKQMVALPDVKPVPDAGRFDIGAVASKYEAVFDSILGVER